jgi:hypothetical protein
MNLHPGLVVRVNQEVVAAVSSENFNIVSVRIGGDVLSSEIATLDVTGGYYGETETRHLLWVTDREISEQDEIEIQFQELAENSHMGKTIEELYPEPMAPADGEPEGIAEIAKRMQDEPRVRKGFDLCVDAGDDPPQIFKVREPDHSFFISAMWTWKSMESAKFSVSSSTLQDIVDRKPGTDYLRRRLGSGQSVRVRILSIDAMQSATWSGDSL